MAKAKSSTPKWVGSGQYTPITRELLKSDAWKTLSGNAFKLYLCMTTHYNGKNGVSEVARKYPNVEHLQRNDLFFFPYQNAAQNGVSANKCVFYRLVNQLQELGFIQIIAKGGRGRMAIYQFSDKWKSWKPRPP